MRLEALRGTQVQSFEPTGITEPQRESLQPQSVARDGYGHSRKGRLGEEEEEGLRFLQRSSLNALSRLALGAEPGESFWLQVRGQSTGL